MSNRENGNNLKPKGSDKTQSLIATDNLTAYLTNLLCDETVFPKRSRWLKAEKIADLMNDFEIHIYLANEINPLTKNGEIVESLRDDRYHALTLSFAYLETLDAMINSAQRAFSIDPSKFDHYAKLYNKCRNYVMAWKNSDLKRFGSPAAVPPVLTEINNVAEVQIE